MNKGVNTSVGAGMLFIMRIMGFIGRFPVIFWNYSNVGWMTMKVH
jgi:hypothetical protein